MFKIINRFRGLSKENYILFIGKLVTSMGAFVWPMLTFFMTIKLGISDSISTLILSLSSFLFLPASYIGGKLADKFNKKWIIVIFDLVSISLYFISAILPFSIFTVVLIFTAAAFQNIESASYDALIADFSSSEQREKAFSLNYLGFNLGFIIGAAISGVLFKTHTALAFILNGVAILISTILIIIFIRVKDTKEQREEAQLISNSIYEDPVDEDMKVSQILRKRKTVFIMMFVSIFAWMPSAISSILLPLSLKESLGEDGAEIYGYLSSLNGATVIIFTPILSYLFEKIDEIRKTALGIFFYLVGLLFFMLSKNTFLLFVGMYIFTLGEICLVVGLSPYQSRRIPLTHRGRIGGLHSILQTLITSICQLSLSKLLDINPGQYLNSWMIFAIITAINLLICLSIRKKDKETFPLLYK